MLYIVFCKAKEVYHLLYLEKVLGALSAQAQYSKDRPVCYGTSRLKNRVCVVTRYALLKTPTLKSNKH